MTPSLVVWKVTSRVSVEVAVISPLGSVIGSEPLKTRFSPATISWPGPVLMLQTLFEVAAVVEPAPVWVAVRLLGVAAGLVAGRPTMAGEGSTASTFCPAAEPVPPSRSVAYRLTEYVSAAGGVNVTWPVREDGKVRVPARAVPLVIWNWLIVPTKESKPP